MSDLESISKGIDCSRLHVGKRLKKKIWFISIPYRCNAGYYNGEGDYMFINKYWLEKFPEDSPIRYEYCNRILSHESLHMVLFHFVSAEATVGIDKLLMAENRYGVEHLDNGGI